MKMSGSEHDLSQEKRYQEALQISESRYRAVFDNTGTAMAIFDADGLLSLVNDEFVHLTGYQKNELEGRMKIWEFVLPEEVDMIREYHRAQRSDPSNTPNRCAFSLVDKSGIRKEIYATVALLPNLRSYIASWIDISPQMRTSETLYRTIIDNLGELVCRYLPDTTLTFVNAAYCRYFGRDRTEMIGRRFLDFIPKEDHADVLENIRNLKQSLTPVTYEHQVLTPSGELRWQRWTDYPIFDLNENLIEFQAVGTDITEQKLAQEAQANAHSQITTLLEISGKLLSTLEFEHLLDMILEQLSKVLPYDGAVIMTLRHQNLEFQVYRGAEIFKNLHKLEVQIFTLPIIEPFIQGKESFYIEDILEEKDLFSMLKRTPEIPVADVMKLGSWLGLPLLIQDQIIGFLILAHSQSHYYSNQDRDLAQAFANQVALALHNAQLYRQAQQAAVMEERNRLARELHDSVVQMLYSMNLYSKASKLALSAGKADVIEENLDRLTNLTRDAMFDMRQLVFELRPVVLEEEGLENALDARVKALGARWRIKTEFQVEGEIELDPAVELELYRIAQEALNNVIKHARASHVHIELKNQAGQYSLMIQDDGIGFDPVFAAQGGGLGLHNIRDRTKEIGGKFMLETSPGQGTIVKIQFRV